MAYFHSFFRLPVGHAVVAHVRGHVAVAWAAIGHLIGAWGTIGVRALHAAHTWHAAVRKCTGVVVGAVTALPHLLVTQVTTFLLVAVGAVATGEQVGATLITAADLVITGVTLVQLSVASPSAGVPIAARDIVHGAERTVRHLL
jgi:hypothetical protein